MKTDLACKRYMVAAFLVLAGSIAVADEPVDFESKGNKFKASFPGDPKVSTEGKGSWYVVEKRFGSYMIRHVGVIPYKEGEEQDILDAYAEDQKPKVKRAIRLQGKYPGLEFQDDLATKQGAGVIVRLFLAHGNLYQVGVVGENTFIQSEDARKFMDSFNILP